MRFSVLLSALCLSLPATQATIFPRQGNNRFGGGNNNNGGDANNNNGGAAGGANNNNGGGGDPQTSLTLDPRVIAPNFAKDGQEVPTEGQVPSLTSINNYINFCLTVNAPITNGQQLQQGSCNPAPIGVIPSVDRMPSSKFTNPKNGDTIASDTTFTISMAIRNLETGHFTNAQATYFANPQTLNGAGIIVGHSHVVIERLTSLAQTTPTNPREFVFFKGLNNAAAGGVLTTDVAGGVPAGAYRLCSINTAATHQPAIVPVAQHGALDDCVYFTASPGGVPAGGNNNEANNGGANNGGANTGGANNGGANNGANGGNAATTTPPASSTSAAPPAATTSQGNTGGNRFRRPTFGRQRFRNRQ